MLLINLWYISYPLDCHSSSHSLFWRTSSPTEWLKISYLSSNYLLVPLPWTSNTSTFCTPFCVLLRLLLSCTPLCPVRPHCPHLLLSNPHRPLLSKSPSPLLWFRSLWSNIRVYIKSVLYYPETWSHWNSSFLLPSPVYSLSYSFLNWRGHWPTYILIPSSSPVSTEDSKVRPADPTTTTESGSNLYDPPVVQTHGPKTYRHPGPSQVDQSRHLTIKKPSDYHWLLQVRTRKVVRLTHLVFLRGLTFNGGKSPLLEFVLRNFFHTFSTPFFNSSPIQFLGYLSKFQPSRLS